MNNRQKTQFKTENRDVDLDYFQCSDWPPFGFYRR